MLLVPENTCLPRKLCNWLPVPLRMFPPDKAHTCCQTSERRFQHHRVCKLLMSQPQTKSSIFLQYTGCKQTPMFCPWTPSTFPVDTNRMLMRQRKQQICQPDTQRTSPLTRLPTPWKTCQRRIGCTPTKTLPPCMCRRRSWCRRSARLAVNTCPWRRQGSHLRRRCRPSGGACPPDTAGTLLSLSHQ